MAGTRLVRRARRQLFLAMVLANLTGVAIVVSCIAWVLPGDEIRDWRTVVVVNAILGGIYLVLVVPVGVIWGEGWLRSGRRWLQEGREPTDAEVTAVLRAPMRLFIVHATLWFAAALLFSILNGILEIELLARVAFTVALGGLTTSAFTYLIAERITRPLAKAALAVHTVQRPRLPGVTTRTMIGWALGTGVPLVGLIITAIFALADPNGATRTKLAVSVIVLGSMALVAGAWVAVLGARAVAEPIVSLRRAIRDLGEGDLSARVEVSDGSVLGLLQAGFNDMAAGIEERERLRDLYQRQVGLEIGGDALARGAELGGACRDVAVLFVDVVGSTRLAVDRPPEEVVDVLNRFFTVVIDEVHEHGGWVNKFQGDATLAVFGAPDELDHAADRALATARSLAHRLPLEVAEVEAGIGVAYGQAVAGNIGDERRFEFTVIGDPVNEAARLTELAKRRDPKVLASCDAVEAAGPQEASAWIEVGAEELRGRTRPTRLAVPGPA
ncbi:MAG: adenylate/guanylate cyclase domain-containing protein [Acidimicrobiales bacterium]|nr:adenylate/guanylate cyclase domain-containing protein [Acidimicrobiales bacterium]HRW37577.1 adenylate/guanylate cyclase domain-containing protein [Aquihabitans sp.]